MINLSNIDNFSSEKISGTLVIKPGAAGWEAKMLPLRYAAPSKDDKAYISWRKPEDIQDHDDGDEAALRDGGRADGRERGRHADRHQAPDRQVLETPELENWWKIYWCRVLRWSERGEEVWSLKMCF